MKRYLIQAALILSVVSGCVNMDSPPETGGARATYGKSFGPPSIPGLQGPYGQSVPMIQPYSNSPPPNQHMAKAMLNLSQPLSSMDMVPGAMPMMGPPGMNMPNMPMPPYGMIAPKGMPPMPGMGSGMQGMPVPPGPMSMTGGLPTSPGMPMMPPMPGMPGGMPGAMPGGMPGGMKGMPPMAGMGMPGMPMPEMPMMPPMPGAMPGAGGPNLMLGGMPKAGPSGLINTSFTQPGASPTGGVLPAQFASSAPVGSTYPAQRTQVFISQPANLKFSWFTQGPDGKPNFSMTPLETPGRYDFAQGAIYRLRLTHIPGRPALELYPTLEVVPTNAKTAEFLSHNAVPLEFTDDDFKQVVDRNYLVKVVYLPDPQYQDAAGAGPENIVSTRLEPGQDPIQEALRRGSILLVVRMGNIDQGLHHSPPMNATGPGGAAPNLTTPPGGQPGGTYTPPPKLGFPGGFQVPYNVTPIPPGGHGHPQQPKTNPNLPPLPNTPDGPTPNPLPLTNPKDVNPGPNLNVPEPKKGPMQEEKKAPVIEEKKVPLPPVPMNKKDLESIPVLPPPRDLKPDNPQPVVPTPPSVPSAPSIPGLEEKGPPVPMAPSIPTPVTPTPVTPTPNTSIPPLPRPSTVPTTPPLAPLPLLPTTPLPPLDGNANPDLPPIPTVPLGGR